MNEQGIGKTQMFSTNNQSSVAIQPTMSYPVVIGSRETHDHHIYNKANKLGKYQSQSSDDEIKDREDKRLSKISQLEQLSARRNQLGPEKVKLKEQREKEYLELQQRSEKENLLRILEKEEKILQKFNRPKSVKQNILQTTSAISEIQTNGPNTQVGESKMQPNHFVRRNIKTSPKFNVRNELFSLETLQRTLETAESSCSTKTQEEKVNTQPVSSTIRLSRNVMANIETQESNKLIPSSVDTISLNMAQTTKVDRSMAKYEIEKISTNDSSIQSSGGRNLNLQGAVMKIQELKGSIFKEEFKIASMNRSKIDDNQLDEEPKSNERISYTRNNVQQMVQPKISRRNSAYQQQQQNFGQWCCYIRIRLRNFKMESGAKWKENYGHRFKSYHRLFWPECEIMTSWLQPIHQYVAHRVGEALGKIDVNEWRKLERLKLNERCIKSVLWWPKMQERGPGSLHDSSILRKNTSIVNSMDGTKMSIKKELLQTFEPVELSFNYLAPLKKTAQVENYPYKRPSILSSHSRNYRLLVSHVKYFHQSHATIVNKIGHQLYIPRIEVGLKKVRNYGQIYKVQLAKLTKPQIVNSPPAWIDAFIQQCSHIEDDYFSPITVKIGGRNEGRMYVLFTKQTSRVVHIDLVQGLDTSSWISYIKKFTADCEIEHIGTYNESKLELVNIYPGPFNELKIELEKFLAVARRTKWHKPIKPLSVNDLVLVVDEKNPRNTYSKARILETKIGSSGQVRRARTESAAKIRTDQSGKFIKIKKLDLWKPVHKLAMPHVSSHPYVGLTIQCHEKNEILGRMEVGTEAGQTQDCETGRSVKNANANDNTGLRRSVRNMKKSGNTK